MFNIACQLATRCAGPLALLDAFRISAGNWAAWLGKHRPLNGHSFARKRCDAHGGQNEAINRFACSVWQSQVSAEGAKWAAIRRGHCESLWDAGGQGSKKNGGSLLLCDPDQRLPGSRSVRSLQNTGSRHRSSGRGSYASSHPSGSRLEEVGIAAIPS